MSLLEQELQQTRPIDDPSLQAILEILKTADLLHRELAVVVEERGLTMQQYNVLRIVRGAGPAGIPVLCIADRMIEGSPNVTRLVDRLATKGLAARRKCTSDRRVVYATLTDAGRKLLDELEAPMQHERRRLCSGLTQGELDLLSRTLEKLRRGVYALGV